MCSSIFVSSTTTTMDNYQGDLTDIIRATSTAPGAYSTITSSSSSEPLLQHHHHHDNQWHPHHQPTSFSNSILEDNRSGTINNINIFGDPLFSTLRDPFLQELDHIPSSSYFNIPTSIVTTSPTTGNIIDVAASGTSSSSSASASVFALDQDHLHHHNHNHNHHEMMRSGSRPCKNIFSNMIQISPNATISNYESSSSTMAPSPRQIKPVVAVSTNININAKDSLLDNTGSGTVQISSSRNNNTGLKRRKNQAKKVVCIPAPAAANSRQTGEVVPSDLWAWRKYGQKPIKGSPYPRGYYRCSSSKGCSARKQVERSRTDPNMLVITYTSEHNHPWPTQRNALAGSTRSQPSKNNTSMKNSETSSQQQNDTTTTTTTTKPKEEQQHQESDGNDSPVVNSVKEENMEDIEKLQIEMVEGDQFNDALSYKPCLMENNQSHEDFFAELGEIEADPLNLLFNQGFGGNSSNDIIHQRDHQSKSLDAFHLFDWSGDNNNNNANNSFEEPNKRRLL